MVEIISEHGGTVHEIIGDALLVSFGAPRPMDDRVEQAVACAIRMQNAMHPVNDTLGAQGLPALQMGIGVHDAEVVVGIVGSERRAKYGIVGSGVNTAARIESYTTGGQILVSQAVVDVIGDMLRLDGQQQMRPKGVEIPLAVYDVGGIAGPHQLFLVRNDDSLTDLGAPIQCEARVVRGKVAEANSQRVRITHLSASAAHIEVSQALEPDLTLKLNLDEVPVRLHKCTVYAKVTATDGTGHDVVFTSVAPEIEAYFVGRLQVARGPAAPSRP